MSLLYNIPKWQSYIPAHNSYTITSQLIPTDEDTSIMYVDANNLYGSALSQKLPVSEFVIFQRPETVNWKTIDTEGPFGYLLEVDLEYPPEIHDATQCF